MQSYFAQGVRKSKSRMKANLFRPLCLVYLVVFHKEAPQLQRIKEITITAPTLQIGADIRKTSIAIFISELLLHVFRRQETSPATFDYIYDAIIRLDGIDENFSGFHLQFMLQLTQHLGFSPTRNISDSNPYFSLREGTFQKDFDPALQCLDKEVSRYFYILSDPDMTHSSTLPISPSIRNKMISACLDYYKYHIAGFGELKSLAVLESIFS